MPRTGETEVRIGKATGSSDADHSKRGDGLRNITV